MISQAIEKLVTKQYVWKSKVTDIVVVNLWYADLSMPRHTMDNAIIITKNVSRWKMAKTLEWSTEKLNSQDENKAHSQSFERTLF